MSCRCDASTKKSSMVVLMVMKKSGSYLGVKARVVFRLLKVVFL